MGWLVVLAGFCLLLALRELRVYVRLRAPCYAIVASGLALALPAGCCHLAGFDIATCILVGLLLSAYVFGSWLRSRAYAGLDRAAFTRITTVQRLLGEVRRDVASDFDRAALLPRLRLQIASVFLPAVCGATLLFVLMPRLSAFAYTIFSFGVAWGALAAMCTRLCKT